MTTRATGIAIAFVTAVVSGIAVYVSAKGVSHFDDATVYTTAKNAVAGLLLVAIALPLLITRRATPGQTGRLDPVLAASGSASSRSPASAGAFRSCSSSRDSRARLRRRRPSSTRRSSYGWRSSPSSSCASESGRSTSPRSLWWCAGQAWLVGGGLGTVTFGAGEAMILAATLLWSIEVILAKHLLGQLDTRMLAAARMGLGTVVLLGWLAVSGRGGDLFALGSEQWMWAIATGLLLTAYVATWYAALARAQAVDVTAVLVFGAVVTALIAGVADGAVVDPVGTALVTAGAVLVALVAVWRPGRRVATT